ncbi:TrwI3 protein [Pusillimonas sp. T7-7]|uniref:type IV secretion system protein n=1 Tax=Pusillimonas sp. (strain T7-7) TaxID=1007105 RepID=UPI0002084C46|nr:type IV secretion system protein [Pusillimonas sp. T7-7]AEC18855.1 TrwI3 protein [Pusillimonas sp. T7-7]
MASVPIAQLSSLGEIVQWLDQTLENMLLAGVAGNVERITTGIWPFLEIGVSIGLLIYGYLIATQQIPTPFGKALGHIAKIALVVGILEAGGFYQTHIMGAMLALPDGFMELITGSPENARDWLAEFHNSGLETATRVEERAPDFWSDIGRTVLFAIVTVIIVLMYTLVTVLGLLLMAVAKAGMALMIMIGPLFIAAALWSKTRAFFMNWLYQTVYFALYGMLFTLVFSLVMGMLTHIQAIIFYMVGSEEINILQVMGVIILAIFVSIFLMKLPSVILSKATGGEAVDMPFLGRL